MGDVRGSGVPRETDDRGSGAKSSQKAPEGNQLITYEKTRKCQEVVRNLDVLITVAAEEDSSQDDLRIEQIDGVKAARWLAVPQNV